MRNFINKIINIPVFLINHFLLWIYRVEYGKRLKISGILHLKGRGGNIVLGNNVKITSGYNQNPLGGGTKTSLVVLKGAALEIGDNVGISNTVIFTKEKIRIGANTIIGAGTIIYDNDSHPLEARYRNPDVPEKILSRPVNIGNNVFIGARSIILKGTTIGDNSVIGAGSVISGTIPENEIWAGNPAKFIKKFNKIIKTC